MLHRGKLHFGCEKCKATARHRVNGIRLCCKCYIRAGFDPADWHPDCLTAYALKKAAHHAKHPDHLGK